MKKLVLMFLLLVSTSSPLNAQWFNRLYLNGSYGYYNHGELGIYAHIFNHFSAGFNSGLTQFKVGPASHMGEGLFPKPEYHRNKYNSRNFFVGVTTDRMARFDASFMIGPSWFHTIEYSDFEKIINSYSPSHYYYKAKREESQTISLVIRAEALFEISQLFGINLSCQQQFNSIRNDFSVMVGINIGIVQDINGGPN